MLPLEIWYLVLDRLAVRKDGAALFALAQADRTLANMALPCLYRICLEVVESQRESRNRNAAKLWRSIILSAEDRTAFPYCLWIKTLDFQHFVGVLGDISYWRDNYEQADASAGEPSGSGSAGNAANGTDLCSLFFGGDMEPYNFLSLDPSDYEVAVMGKAGETITRFIEKAAGRGEQAVSLVGLQLTEDVPDLLPVWAARLPTLEQLHVAGCSCLSTEVASAIRDHCPRFRNLAIDGEFLDETVVASFLHTLRPGCLGVFSAVGPNDLSDETFGALAAAHAPSLRRLELSLTPASLVDLGALRPIVSLERLNLYGVHLRHRIDDSREGALRPCQRLRNNKLLGEAFIENKEFMPSWRTTHETSFANTAAWLGACASLASLTLFGLSDIGELLRVVLQSPTLRLRYLHVDVRVRARNIDKACFLNSLRHQTALEGFTFGWRHGLDIPGSPAHQLLMQCLGQCPQLRALKLIDTPLTPTNLAQLASSLPNLEVLMFDSDTEEVLEDTAFEPLLAMPKLKRLCIDSPSRFTMEGMFGYIEAVAAQGRHTRVAFGYQLDISYKDMELLLERARSLGVDFEILSGI